MVGDIFQLVLDVLRQVAVAFQMVLYAVGRAEDKGKPAFFFLIFFVSAYLLFQLVEENYYLVFLSEIVNVYQIFQRDAEVYREYSEEEAYHE